MAGLRAGQDRQCPVRGATRCPRQGCRGTGFRAAPGWNHDSAATAPCQGRDGGGRLDRRGRYAAQLHLQDARARRGDAGVGGDLTPAGRDGRRVLRGLRHCRSLGRRRARGRGRTRRTPSPRPGCGHCRPDSPASTPSGRVCGSRSDEPKEVGPITARSGRVLPPLRLS